MSQPAHRHENDDRARRAFRTFQEQGGKFRVAVINRCNLDCFFCHNEAMANPRRQAVAADALDLEDLLAIITAYADLGGRQVNITGGEPLAHPGIVDFLERIPPGEMRVVMNTNAVLVSRLLRRPRIERLDGILASLHTTKEDIFREDLGGRNVGRVMGNIAALKKHGYAVAINYSLGPYNADEFEGVPDFAVEHGIDLKTIALVRPHDRPGFYGGDWVDPSWIRERLERRGARFLGERAALGGQTTSWGIGDCTIRVKNIADGRLETDMCSGCTHKDTCGEGVYGVRVGVDGLWKPCLLCQEWFHRVRADQSYTEQILGIVEGMIGHWPNASFRGGAPS